MPRNSTAYNKRPKKRFGQNFLQDDSVIDSIIHEADILRDECVLEIGPGKGILTERLLASGAEVVAVEIDRDLSAYLKERFKDKDNFTLIEGDILKQDLKSITCGYSTLKVVANLPYYITTPILMQLLESGIAFDKIIVMVQKEVGDRMLAHSGTADYGALTLAINFYSYPKLVVDVPARCFYPVPKVDSCVVCLERKQPPVEGNKKDLLFSCVKAAFAQRRKTLINGLGAGGIVSKEEAQKALIDLGYDVNIRGERLDLKEYMLLVEKIIEIRGI